MGVKNPYGITVREEKNTVPFSRGILASSVAEIGFDTFEAYRIADHILRDLQKRLIHEVDSEQIRNLVTEEIEKIDPLAAKRYLFSRKQKKGSAREETIVLIGGTSGVGTTTIGYETASRLNIKNIVSTDTIREIMRVMISAKLSPELHRSTFNASEESSIPIPQGYDPAVFGFERQASLVSVGIDAVVSRALKEGHSLVVEGVHVVPGFIADEITSRDRTFTFLLTISDADTHRNRFTLRSLQSDLKRPAGHYLNYFEEIRRIQDYLKTRAEESGFSVFENEDSDYTVELMLESILSSIQYDFDQ
jgi:2-phosphoglycerate kinase